MFIRLECAVRPEFTDPGANHWLKTIQVAMPDLGSQISSLRLLEVYWLDLPLEQDRVEMLIHEIFLDRVMGYVFNGNAIRNTAGMSGEFTDILNDKKFWGIEKRFRAGVTDNVGRTVLEAIGIVEKNIHPSVFEQMRVLSGSLLLVEGQESKNKSSFGRENCQLLAQNLFSNKMIEESHIINPEDLISDERFRPETIRNYFTKRGGLGLLQPLQRALEISIDGLSNDELIALSNENLWALNLHEMQAIQSYFGAESERELRKAIGLDNPTDVELEIIAQTWSEHCKHKIFNAEIDYKDESKIVIGESRTIPEKIESLFKATISGTTSEIKRNWLLSVFSDNAGIIAFDDEFAFSIKVETHNSPSALDPYGGALTGIVGVNRDILGCGLGAKPIFNTNVFCVADPGKVHQLPEKILDPRRILSGVRRGVEHGGNKSGIPTINGALCFDDRYLGKPLVYCGTGGFMPLTIAGRGCAEKEVVSGDIICMVGGRIGKDGIHGATFSSLALDESSPTSAVQLGDPITQKRMSDFLFLARDLGLYRALTDNGAGGLSSSVGEMATLSGGAILDVTDAKTKYPGLKPFELVISESQERMTCAVPPEKIDDFEKLAKRQGVEVSRVGHFTQNGRLEVVYQSRTVAFLSLDFLHKGNPKLKLSGRFNGPKNLNIQAKEVKSIFDVGADVLKRLLVRPNIASKEYMIRQYDHEVQGMSVIKPLHTAWPGTADERSGPNDGGVIKPRSDSWMGLAVGSGIQPGLSDYDSYLMAQAAVDEALRNVLCVGAEYGNSDSIIALTDNFCWPDPIGSEEKTAALVRACYGMREACLKLGLPLVSGKDSMKNDFKGKRNGEEVKISVPPTLLITAVARVKDVRLTKSSDFKIEGDDVFLIGPAQMGLIGSELYRMTREDSSFPLAHGISETNIGLPNWEAALKLYSWIGQDSPLHREIHSIHDISEGGLLVALSEGLFARNFGITISNPTENKTEEDIYNFLYGEGFHSFIVSINPSVSEKMKNEWSEKNISHFHLGTLNQSGILKVNGSGANQGKSFQCHTKNLFKAWSREGYFE